MYIDLSGQTYTPGLFSDAQVPREGGAEASPSGFWDFVTQGAQSAGSIAREYFAAMASRDAAQAAGNPERTTEYLAIPRDFGGGGATAGGVALSWQVVALVALAGFAWYAMKGNA